MTESAVDLLAPSDWPACLTKERPPVNSDGSEAPSRPGPHKVDVVDECGIGWPPDDARILLLQPGVGPALLSRLQAAGIRSLADLRALGVVAAIERICTQTGTRVWRNKLRALRSLGAP